MYSYVELMCLRINIKTTYSLRQGWLGSESLMNRYSDSLLSLSTDTSVLEVVLGICCGCYLL